MYVLILPLSLSSLYVSVSVPGFIVILTCPVCIMFCFASCWVIRCIQFSCVPMCFCFPQSPACVFIVWVALYSFVRVFVTICLCCWFLVFLVLFMGLVFQFPFIFSVSLFLLVGQINSLLFVHYIHSCIPGSHSPLHFMTLFRTSCHLKWPKT